ncbi:hypothetical protein R1sor_008493 [Riccia sorocarpa]|uniref:Uncharacterized protein n=1 Tax=Riccia sorocarpa TaxID=122646 RepID=A0ABD3HX41_9MARC
MRPQADGAGEKSRKQLGDASPSGLMAEARSPEQSSEMRPQADGAGEKSRTELRDAFPGGLMEQPMVSDASPGVAKLCVPRRARSDASLMNPSNASPSDASQGYPCLPRCVLRQCVPRLARCVPRRCVPKLARCVPRRCVLRLARCVLRRCGLRGVLVVVVALAAVSWPVWLDLHLMARTKQTARKYPVGKPPDPRQGQQYKLTQHIVKKRRMSDKDRQRMEEDEEEEQQEEQEEEQEGEAEDEAEDEADEDEIGTLELTVKPKEVFVKLVEFEQELKSIKGKNKRKTDGEGMHFKAMVSQTMGRKSHKEVISLVCCSDETFFAFERFRPVNGLSDEELKQVWTLLESGAVWVAKPAKYQGSEAVVSFKDYCKKLKAICSLDKRVVKYWPSRNHEVYDKWSDLEKTSNFPDKWLESMLKYIPEKADKEVAADEASSSDVEIDDGNTRRGKKGKKKSFVADPLPSQIASAIHRVYCAKRGESAPKRLEPLEVLHIKDITKYQLTLDEKLECPLVFLDLTHPHMHAWEKPEFSSFLGIVRDLIVSKCFAVIAIMDFGQAPVDFAHALKDMKDARVAADYGCYEVKRVHNRTDLPYPCWQLIYAFVSLVAEDYTLVS